MDDRLGPLVMRVFVVRHGDALDALLDPTRPLSPAGRDEASRLADWCAARSVVPDEIRHSGVLRAAQTAEILGAKLAPRRGVKKVRGLAPEDDPDALAEELVHETAPVMLVSHMPLVGALSSILGGPRAPGSLATGAIACFERTGAKFHLTATWRPR